MFVVSVLGVLGMGLRNTVKKVLYDYEAYICKKIEKAYINAYLVYNQNGDFFTLCTQLVFLVLLSGDFNKFYKYATDILLPENLDPLLPKGIVKGKGDLMNFYRHSDIKEIVCPNGEDDATWKLLIGETKNKKGLQLNYVRGVNLIVFFEDYYMVEIDEKLIPFFKKQNFVVGVLENGKSIAVKEIDNVIDSEL